MMRNPAVSSFDINTIEAEYDAVIAAIGYERRARYVVEEYLPNAKSYIAFPFQDRHAFSFNMNLKVMTKLGFNVIDTTEDNFGHKLRGALECLDQSPMGMKKILVDISSFNRTRLAEIVDYFRCYATSDCQVDFVYSLAKYSKPPSDEGPNIHVGPVLPSFAGWSTEAEAPPVAVVGLGYEEDKAIGAIEHIQASEVFAFVPVSPIEKYNDAVHAANKNFLAPLKNERIFEYRLHEPLETYVKLETLVRRLEKDSSPILFPFGPKIFHLITLIVASLYDQVSVWRVSAGQFGKPSDRRPSEHIIGLRVSFREN